MERIDTYPTHFHDGFRLRVGKPFPFGATPVPGGVNFSIFSRHAISCVLVLFHHGQQEPLAELPFPDEFRIGNVFAMIVFDVDYEHVEYGYRMRGPYTPRQGHRFDSNKVLLDPYAKAVSGRDMWGEPPNFENPYQPRARLVYDDFDWEADRPLEIPIEDLIIYEMHVRGFTRHPSSGVKHPGTFAAIREKIPYLKHLGVNCIELMPICEFDEFDNPNYNTLTGERLMNYWGYNTVAFFAPKAGYAATGRLGMQVDEFKALVKELHRNRIEVVLDMVFNHTAEGNGRGPTLSFRGIDNQTYYMLAPDGRYLNFSGTGNTMNCNNPVVRSMVLDCLRYWASEYHIDGFRFDLASILGRDQNGMPLANPPLLESLAHDPILAKCKLIAEAWDAGGLYQVGTFPAYQRWAEWNGKYRDTIRRFLKGDAGIISEVAQRLQGSPDLYGERGAWASINFVTCHDGFTLRDLVSYNQKHNESNGENNADGTNDNYSWNCGREGETDDPEVNGLRMKLMKNAVALLMVSRGVPMILMGDEAGHTKCGNNNTYAYDNDLNWLHWTQLKSSAELFRFFRYCIMFRKAHPMIRSRTHLQRNPNEVGYPPVSWHGTQAWRPEWEPQTRTLALMLCGESGRSSAAQDDYVYVAMNAHWEAHLFELPVLPKQMRWHLFADTSATTSEDIWQPGKEPLLADQQFMRMEPRSVTIVVGK
jgi:glycogen operon protein